MSIDADVRLRRADNLIVARKHLAKLAGPGVEDGNVRLRRSDADIEEAVLAGHDPAAIFLGGVHPAQVSELVRGRVVADQTASGISDAVEAVIGAESDIPDVLLGRAGAAEVDQAMVQAVDAEKVRVGQASEVDIAVRPDSDVACSVLARDRVVKDLRRAIGGIDGDDVECVVGVEIAGVETLGTGSRSGRHSRRHEATERAIAAEELEARSVLPGGSLGVRQHSDAKQRRHRP